MTENPSQNQDNENNNHETQIDHQIDQSDPSSVSKSEVPKYGEELNRLIANSPLSPDEICKRTKINPRIFQAILDSEFESLPNIVFVKGFVKNICKCIKVDSKDVLEQLDRCYQVHLQKSNQSALEANTSETDSSTFTTTPVPTATGSHSQSSKNLAIATEIPKFFNRRNVLVVASIVVALGLYQLITMIAQKDFDTQESTVQTPTSQNSSEQFEEDLTGKEVNDLDNQPELSEDKNLLELKKYQDLRKSSENNNRPVKSETNVAKQDLKEKSTEPSLQEDEKPSPTKENDSFNKTKKFPFIEFKKLSDLNISFRPITDGDETTKSIFPKSKWRSQGQAAHELFLYAADGDAWISFKSDESSVKTIILKQGKSKKISGSRIFALIGNLNAIKVFYDNQEVIAPTKTSVKNLVFPLEEVIKQRYPLFVSAPDGKTYFHEDYIQMMIERPEDDVQFTPSKPSENPDN